MTKKITLIFILVLAAFLIAAFLTKPDDKKIKIETVDAVWGKKVPNKNITARFYEQFMNTVTPDIIIDDWVFLKRIRYLVNDSSFTVGYAIFGNVIIRK